MQGQIIKIISNQYTVLINEERIICQVRGVFRNLKITPLVGDFCLVSVDEKVIYEILPRKNTLVRPNVANIDFALIITSVKEPELSLNLLDKLLTTIIHNQVKPVICLTKIDLLKSKEKKEINKLIKYYEKIGIKVFDNQHLKKIIKYLKNKTVVLTGQTGSGKSTLINNIDPKFKLEVGEISKSLKRGKHTTRHVELYKTHDILFMDTPGYSSIDFINYTLEEINNTFIEFASYPCEFLRCTHFKEKNCGVIKAVKQGKILESRYENYLKFGGLK